MYEELSKKKIYTLTFDASRILVYVIETEDKFSLKIVD